MDAKVAIGLMLPLLMLMDLTGLYFYWKKWVNSAPVKILILGGIPGVCLQGQYFLLR